MLLKFDVFWAELLAGWCHFSRVKVLWVLLGHGLGDSGAAEGDRLAHTPVELIGLRVELLSELLLTVLELFL